MKEFVERLRALEKPGSKSEYKNVSLNAVVTNVQQLLSSSLVTNNIELDLHLAYELPPFLGDASLVENALINLFINARDAFDRVTDEREKKITIKSMLSPAGNLCLEFSDNACGIPEGIQDRLFDPLFTTSEVKHNGLGLTLVREIIHQHDGDVFFFSTENEGTTFKIFLPKHIDANSDAIRPRPRNIRNYSKDFTLFYIPQKSDFGTALRDFLLNHYNVVVCEDAKQIDESALRSCNLALGEWPGEEEEGILLVDTIKKISPQIPLVVMGRNIGDEKLLKKIFHRGAQEVLSREFSKLDIIHDIIRKHINS